MLLLVLLLLLGTRATAHACDTACTCATARDTAHPCTCTTAHTHACGRACTFVCAHAHVHACATACATFWDNKYTFYYVVWVHSFIIIIFCTQTLETKKIKHKFVILFLNKCIIIYIYI